MGLALRSINDAQAAAILANRALAEIRFLAGNRPSWNRTSEGNLDRIRFIADLCHNMPGAARPRRFGRLPRRERALSWAWTTATPKAKR